MSKAELLQQYKNDINKLRQCARSLDLSDEEITRIFRDCFVQLHAESSSSNRFAQKYFTLVKVSICFVFIAFFLYILLNVHQPTSSLVLRNVQGLIYPGLKILRFLSVPIIKTFPALTGLYDESCLLENPYFYVSDMECWPCENVYSVVDLTGFNNQSLYQSGIPYVVKTPQKEVSFETLQRMYFENRNVFDAEATNIRENSTIADLNRIFKENPSRTSHILWRINKMSPGRILRGLFPRPYIISEWSGQSIESFLLIDGNNAAPYTLPNTECGYIFLIQASGERTIILRPSKECGETCRTVSITLKPSHVLWYNWWYWRPISLPTRNSTETSISYMNSHC